MIALQLVISLRLFYVVQYIDELGCCRCWYFLFGNCSIILIKKGCCAKIHGTCGDFDSPDVLVS
jgi:hypothetical protein